LQNAFFVLEHAANRLFAQRPHLGDFRELEADNVSPAYLQSYINRTLPIGPFHSTNRCALTKCPPIVEKWQTPHE
jgi:hypothetical protein